MTATACGNPSPDKERKNSSFQNKTLSLGIMRTAEYLPNLTGQQVGVVGNQTSIFPGGNEPVHLVDSLLSLEVDVRKVFAPEHGFRGTADAGEIIKDGKDPKTGLPVISLYGSNKKPSPEQLKDLDILVFDIQDVGARFYTYISTLHYVMEAAAENGIRVLVLDRPNPNGHYIDGPILEPAHTSFVGMHPVPIVHGMTIGEYAKMINGEGWLNEGVQADLTVIEMKNYHREEAYDLPVKPSPNLPNAQSINLYPSLCFFEGTNVNAGRGTTKQFQVFGSPYLPKETFTYSYTPESREGAQNPKHLGETCYGKDLSSHPRLQSLNLEWLISAYNNTADQSTFFNPFFTKLAGTTKLQTQIEKGMTGPEIRKTWEIGLSQFREVRESYLLY